MPLYQIVIYRPVGYDPSLEGAGMMEEIHALNREMIAAGARKFAGGLTPPEQARALRVHPNGKVLVTDGPYSETKEQIGGFWILETASEEEAVEWARKGAVACRASSEVRQIFFQPDSGGPEFEDTARSLDALQSKKGGEGKRQFLVTIVLPDNFDPSTITAETIEDMNALEREMAAADARKFACGLAPASTAKSLRRQADGKVVATDGPYIETKEHVGGLSIIEAADLDEAVEWARKGAVACRAPGEVRELLFKPAAQK